MDPASAVEVQRAFQVEARGRSTIDYRGFSRVLKSLGLREDPGLVQVMVRAADADMSGFLDLTDVLNAVDYALLRSLPVFPAGGGSLVRSRKDHRLAPVALLDAAGALIRTGPSGTNLNDVVLGIRIG